MLPTTDAGIYLAQKAEESLQYEDPSAVNDSAATAAVSNTLFMIRTPWKRVLLLNEFCRPRTLRKHMEPARSLHYGICRGNAMQNHYPFGPTNASHRPSTASRNLPFTK